MGMKEALLVLRDGRVFRGQALGAEGETTGEVIFNTAMSVHSSTPTTLAGISRLSPRTTDTCALVSPITWLFVSR